MAEQMYKREIAYRVFSDGFEGAEVVERDAEDMYAPQYTKLKTGELISRVYICGVLTEVSDIGTDSEYFKLVVSDPKGTFRAYVGQYQEIALASMTDITAPCYVAIVAKVKPNEFNEKMFFNLAPESINVIEESTYNRWVEETESQTADRMAESNEAV
jgi:RPA family protein